MPVIEDKVKLQRTGWSLSICLLFAVPGNAQSQNRPSDPASHGTHASPPLPGDPIPGSNGDESQQRMMHEMAKKANLERHAALKTDTEKLLKLAEELKPSGEKSSSSVRSLEGLKKAEEL